MTDKIYELRVLKYNTILYGVNVVCVRVDGPG